MRRCGALECSMDTFRKGLIFSAAFFTVGILLFWLFVSYMAWKQQSERSEFDPDGAYKSNVPSR